MFFESILPVALVFLVVTASPGPAIIAVSLVTLQQGRKDGLLFGLGLAVGLGFWGLIAATGLGVLLQSSAQALIALKIIGGLYLLWLAWQSFRSSMNPRQTAAKLSSKGRWLWKGLLLNLSNPKAVFAWMAALSMGLGNDASGALIAITTTLCIAIGLLTYGLYALAFSLPGIMEGYRRIRRSVDAVVAGLFAVAGLGLIRSAVSR
ncbi:LysE family transporter [uncultured Roseobacter sp.]|uniref:LysE family translocator n=1 Tax=uncultured Roseobacter sp. TaxID=114847 RepID=UPI002620B55D|nr:LysE family transporter [uncultured Roseobacter sp.]